MNQLSALEGCKDGRYWIRSVVSPAAIAWWNAGNALNGKQWLKQHSIGEIAAHELGHVVGYIGWGFGKYLNGTKEARQDALNFTNISACYSGRAFRQQTGLEPGDADEANPDECRSAIAFGLQF